MSRSASEPLRTLTEEESQELHRVGRASSEPHIRHQRALALLAVAEGKSLSEAARLAGWKSHDPVTRLTRRFNTMGLGALDDLPRSGPHRRYGPDERARILQEARYSWQKNRTWCHTGRTLKKGKDGTVYQSEDPYTQEKKP